LLTLLAPSSARAGALVHHVGSRCGSIDEVLFVSGNFVGAKTGHPGGQVVAVGEDKFGHWPYSSRPATQEGMTGRLYSEEHHCLAGQVVLG
jgi:hypothetical protein